MPADNPVGDALLCKHPLEGKGLGIHAVQNSVIRKLPALCHPFQNGPGNAVCLVLLVFRCVKPQLLPGPGGCPQGFPLALQVVFDDRVGGVQYVLGGAVVLLQPHHLSPGVVLLKIHDVLNGGPPELVDALVVVAHHAQVPVFFRQEVHKFILCVVGVLIFVHHNVLELILVIFQHLRRFFKEPHRVYQQIVKVHGVRVLQPPLVQGVAPGNLLEPIVLFRCHLIFPGGDKLLLGPGNLRQHRPVGKGLFRNVQLAHYVLHQAAAVVCIINGEMGGVAQPVPVPAEYPGTACVEGGGPDIVAWLSQHGAQPLL